MKGLKLHAGVGYMPDDPVCYWVYEKAAQYNIPIMAHTGGAPSVALRWENSRPAYFASAAARYPEVDFIFAHCGDVGWWREVIQAAARLARFSRSDSGGNPPGDFKGSQYVKSIIHG
jgi:predicted TIM-barrel fold metal-dependent hydrolase